MVACSLTENSVVYEAARWETNYSFRHELLHNIRLISSSPRYCAAFAPLRRVSSFSTAVDKLLTKQKVFYAVKRSFGSGEVYPSTEVVLQPYGKTVERSDRFLDERNEISFGNLPLSSEISSVVLPSVCRSRLASLDDSLE